MCLKVVLFMAAIVPFIHKSSSGSESRHFHIVQCTLILSLIMRMHRRGSDQGVPKKTSNDDIPFQHPSEGSSSSRPSTSEDMQHTTTPLIHSQTSLPPYTPMAHLWAMISGLQCRVDFLEAAIFQGHHHPSSHDQHMITTTHDDLPLQSIRKSDISTTTTPRWPLR